MNASSENGLAHLDSKHSVDETLQRLQSLLQEKNVKVLALVDHSGEPLRVLSTSKAFPATPSFAASQPTDHLRARRDLGPPLEIKRAQRVPRVNIPPPQSSLDVPCPRRAHTLLRARRRVQHQVTFQTVTKAAGS